MSSMLYLATVLTIFERNIIKCYGVRNKAILQEVPNDIDMLIKPIKKMSAIFPNHEIEVQFDIERSNFQPEKVREYKFNRPVLRTSETLTTLAVSELTTTGITRGAGKQLVYLDDMKKALEEFEKKLNLTINCNQHISSSTPKEGSESQIMDIFKLLKKSVQLQKHVQKPNDDEISWLKIQVPV